MFVRVHCATIFVFQQPLPKVEDMRMSPKARVSRKHLPAHFSQETTNSVFGQED